MAMPAPGETLLQENPTPVDWETVGGLTPYPAAVEAMERRVAAILDGSAGEAVWLVEHPPLYTAGTSARPSDLLDAARLPVFASGRGGQYTYHGPGQRVAYAMLDLRRRRRDVRALVRALEGWIVATVADFGVSAFTRPDRVGVWVRREAASGEDKIAAVGLRLRHWVSYHGISLNVAPDLSHYAGIVPCGVTDQGVTSLAALGVGASMAEVDAALRRRFDDRFGPTAAAGAVLL